MKKRYLQMTIAALTGAGAFYFGKMNLNFFMGALFGIALLFLITATIGYWIMRNHISRLDKLERDYLQGIQHSVEKEHYE